MRNFLRYWLPVLLWASVIFLFSTGLGAPRHTSRIIGPILRWFNPNVTDQTIADIQYGMRKVAHFTEYAILSVLLWRARRRPRPNDTRPWQSGDAFFAVCVALFFAASDEWHQTFVPSRDGKPQDVLLDGCGAATAMFVVWRRWERKVAKCGVRSAECALK